MLGRITMRFNWCINVKALNGMPNICWDVVVDILFSWEGFTNVTLVVHERYNYRHRLHLTPFISPENISSENYVCALWDLNSKKNTSITSAKWNLSLLHFYCKESKGTHICVCFQSFNNVKESKKVLNQSTHCNPLVFVLF